MNKAKDIFKSNVDTFFKDIINEHNETVIPEWNRVYTREEGGQNIKGKNPFAKPYRINDHTLLMKYGGQKFWNLEFGKGEGAGLVSDVNSNYKGGTRAFSSQQEFASSRLFHWTYRNPRRGKRYKEKIYTGERTKPYPIQVTSKKGKKFSRYITRAKYKIVTPKDTRLRIYSRPGDYQDLDGVIHHSDMPVEIWLEKPGVNGELTKPQLSVRGAFAVTYFWGFDFVKKKVANNNLQKTDAYKSFEENLITEIEEYLFDK
jgi:hypothetical protein